MATDRTVERAIELATGKIGGSGLGEPAAAEEGYPQAVSVSSTATLSASAEDAVAELADNTERGALENAREALVARVRARSDDYDATAALSLVNKALSRVGRIDPYSWKHRRKP